MEVDTQQGPFLLQSVLGEGGMGCVYEGLHTATGKRYAVKTTHITSPLLRSRLRTEIRALSELDHPFIVRVRMNGVDDEIPWYAMDLLDGPTLRSYIHPYQENASIDWDALANNKPSIQTQLELPMRQHSKVDKEILDLAESKPHPFLDMKWICRFFQHLCEALDYLHSRGIVHADIKPENIFVIENNLPVLVDLGIASRFYFNPRDVLQTSDRTAGTVAYSPLEQIEGELLDPRADLYALGCTLYECLTGIHPFQRNTSAAMITAKVTADFLPASHYRKEIPPSLDLLISRLLAAEPHHRIGHAADVAEGLYRIEPLPKSDRSRITAASTYLYRPPLIGRDPILNQLSRCMDDAMSGEGSGILIRGESGIGKTRLVSEVAKEARKRGFSVVGLSCARFIEQENSASDTPVQGTVQSLLREIEDTGLASNLLSRSQNAATNDFGKTLIVSESSRSSILENATSVLLGCSKAGPVLLVIDDFHWADELLVRLISDLAGRHLKRHRMLIIAMARTEPGGDESNPVFQIGMRDVHLPQLTDEQVCLQVRRMLGVDHPPEELLSYICEVSGGIPLLIVEHLHAAVDAGVLSRNRLQGWIVHLSRDTGLSSKIPSSRSIETLITNRLSQLDEQTRTVIQAASVLGRELDLAELKLLLGCNDDRLDQSIATLRHREIAAFEGENRIRFTHARLHEHIYNTIPLEQRAALHQKAASVIEQSGVTPNRTAALAFHFDKSGAPDKAAHFYEIAGRHAAQNQQYGFAEQAIESALENIARMQDDLDSTSSTGILLLEALGDVSCILRHQDKAASAYERVASLSTDDSIRTARQHRKLATVYQADRKVSLTHLQRARHFLEAEQRDILEKRSEWIQVNIQCLWAHYWGNEPGELLSLAYQIEPEAEAYGSIKQRGELQLMIALGRMQHKRYVTDANEIQRARSAVDHLSLCEDVQVSSLAKFILAMIYLFAGDWEKAEEGFRKTIADAAAASNITLQLRGMTYLSFLHRQRRDVEHTRQTAAAVLALAEVNAMPEYSAAASGNLAWIAYLEGDLESTERLAEDACRHWNNSPIVYPFWWTALFPLLAAMSQRNRESEVGWILDKLLEPKQQALPQAVTKAIELCQSQPSIDMKNSIQSILDSARYHSLL
jgi:serine/threonine protein kinase/tetratricopeptide (TPR) repeat protein